MQVLIEKNTLLSQELEECKAQLEAALAAAGEAKETPSGTYMLRKISML